MEKLQFWLVVVGFRKEDAVSQAGLDFENCFLFCGKCMLG